MLMEDAYIFSLWESHFRMILSDVRNCKPASQEGLSHQRLLHYPLLAYQLRRDSSDRWGREENRNGWDKQNDYLCRPVKNGACVSLQKPCAGD